MPLSLVRDLWEMDDESTERCAKQMERVGLVQLQYGERSGGLRVHNLTHVFAVQEAKKKECVNVWRKKMADAFSAGRGLLAMGERRDREGKSTRKNYVFENLSCSETGWVRRDAGEFIVECAMGEGSDTERRHSLVRGICEGSK